jgi:hypothetical protein
MRQASGIAAIVLAACAHATGAERQEVAPEVEGDGSSCEQPIVVQASSDRAATRWEYEWLAKHYPNHSAVAQGLRDKAGRTYDELRFRDAAGREVFVCFDITHTFGI